MVGFDELLDRVGLVKASVSYRYLNFGGKAVYLAGFKELLSLSNENVVLRLSNRERISILGQELTLREMDKETVIISGKITKIEVE